MQNGTGAGRRRDSRSERYLEVSICDFCSLKGYRYSVKLLMHRDSEFDEAKPKASVAGYGQVESAGRFAARNIYRPASRPWRPINARRTPLRAWPSERPSSVGIGDERLLVVRTAKDRKNPTSEEAWGKFLLSLVVILLQPYPSLGA